MLYDQFRQEVTPNQTIRQKIATLAKSFFNWQPPTLFFGNENPVIQGSDDEASLSILISDQIKNTDTVLTTPGQIKLFDNNKTSVFDLNPTHLERVISTHELPPGNVWWCDIFNTKMFKALLNQVSPTIVNLTNIPEYSPSNVELNNLLKNLLEHESVRGIIWSRHGDMLELSESHQLAQILKEKNIKVKEYVVNKHQCIYWAELKNSTPDTH